jgi:hypothetical protein
MTNALPITPRYRKPIYEGLLLQFLVGLLSLMILDMGECARICGISLVAFWCGAAVLIWRKPWNPSKLDLSLIRIGYLFAVAIAQVLVPLIWAARGVRY